MEEPNQSASHHASLTTDLVGKANNKFWDEERLLGGITAETHIDSSGAPVRTSLKALTKADFYQQEDWIDELCEILFKIKRRNTTIRAELYYGVIHFISCLYCLAVIPQQLTAAGYGGRTTVVS